MFDIFQFDFMIRAFVAGAVIAVIAPLIGNFLVVRRYSLMADTLAHVSLAGVAIGLLLGTQPIVSAVVVSVCAAIAIDHLRDKQKIYGESVLAMFLSGSLAIAVLLLSIANGFSFNILSVLFGSITTVSGDDLYYIVILGMTVLLLIALFYKELFFVSFDEELAAASGLRVRVYNSLLVVLAAVTVALSMRIVGALLIGALMVIPVIAAIQLGRGFRSTIFSSMILSIAAVLAGLFLSYYLNLPSGATIVVLSLFFFLLTTLFTKKI